MVANLMAIVFLSYRRSDSPQAFRVYDWLVQRMGEDAVFIDVVRIPSAVSFEDHIRQEVGKSRVVLSLIGPGWSDRLNEENDPVRFELETAIRNQIPILPVLIGNTPMPGRDDLPESISMIAVQNAVTVGVANDFQIHMRSLMRDLDTILSRAVETVDLFDDPDLIHRACQAIVDFLAAKKTEHLFHLEYKVLSEDDFYNPSTFMVGLYLHRVRRVAELLELHFILVFWADQASLVHHLVGWAMKELELTPVLDSKVMQQVTGEDVQTGTVKIRRSDEDPRQVLQMLRDAPFKLSLAYVATIYPTKPGNERVSDGIAK